MLTICTCITHLCVALATPKGPLDVVLRSAECHGYATDTSVLCTTYSLLIWSKRTYYCRGEVSSMRIVCTTVGTSKAGLDMVTKVMALELGSHKVSFNLHSLPCFCWVY